ncbi:DNA-binding protein [Metarhizium album ARSEF 1941]|uniref:DNA-binding protein n=1 Tax=Metarhizium album (strain ARSEF 1941) TaxID=1081103 RepID=A0A0B2WWN2_METAS|nr:DNA-binding protein [Metarhizium album ARSEF 1941]KHN97250.1 DNA-binding protein [Metarhizium album ARSEF 1941]
MPFVANTPESLLDRADSRNPTSTCRGITSNGRPCRRPISRSPGISLAPRNRGPRVDLSDEALYCWQHKEQAIHSARSSPGPNRVTKPILEERSSLDTLADRLGVVHLEEKKRSRQKQSKEDRGTPPRTPVKAPRPRTRPKLQLCFCFHLPLEEVSEPARPKPRPQLEPVHKPAPSASMPNLPGRHCQDGKPGGHGRIATPNASPSKASYRSGRSAASQTARFRDLVPDSLDMTTASALMAELAKPHADSDEAGYIYMFWLTPASKQAPPPVEAARSLLAPSPPSPARSRRPSDIVSTFADPSDKGDKSTMLLKIGRAANVQRRMNQWQRQCGYDIEMLRYYPYVGASNERPGVSRTPRMTPHCRRVERLVHIELAGMGLRANASTCRACGREHREWFEVKATREGIRKVDDVIRRWVDWDETSLD